ncbi:hypothetical protein BRC88_08910 [Halobacteriales archaeon QS_4_69_225]|nr:MAG: hypothetical protein BRC88_08910 [Halobacteriales archaeon QS_4_69_225]
MRARPAATRRSPAESETVVGEGGARDSGRNPYAGYENGDDIGAGHGGDDDRLHYKAQVLGIGHGAVARAYPTLTAREAGVIDDDVDGLPVIGRRPGKRRSPTSARSTANPSSSPPPTDCWRPPARGGGGRPATPSTGHTERAD